MSLGCIVCAAGRRQRYRRRGSEAMATTWTPTRQTGKGDSKMEATTNTIFQVIIDGPADKERALAEGTPSITNFYGPRNNRRAHSLAKARATREKNRLARLGYKASLWDCCHALDSLFSI